LISCATATFKIYGYNGITDEEDFSNLINKYYREDSKITLRDLIKWCSKVNEI
jgi:hypothetical protein